jgi:hypothetical protein
MPCRPERTIRARLPCRVESPAVVLHLDLDRGHCRVESHGHVNTSAVRMVEGVADRLLGGQEQVAGHEVGDVERRAGHGNRDLLATAESRLRR